MNKTKKNLVRFTDLTNNKTTCLSREDVAICYEIVNTLRCFMYGDDPGQDDRAGIKLGEAEDLTYLLAKFDNVPASELDNFLIKCAEKYDYISGSKK